MTSSIFDDLRKADFH